MLVLKKRKKTWHFQHLTPLYGTKGTKKLKEIKEEKYEGDNTEAIGWNLLFKRWYNRRKGPWILNWSVAKLVEASAFLFGQTVGREIWL